MLYVIAGSVVGFGILGLIAYFLYKRNMALAKENVALSTDRDAYKRLGEIEDRLKDEVSKDRRAELEKEAADLKARSASAKPGEVIENALGAKPEEPKS